MGKKVFITEKPSVAQEFAAVLKLTGKSADGYLENDEVIVTWCLGHLVTMSYPDAYDEKWKRWNLDMLPFLPEEFRYEVIGSSRKQFLVIKKILTRKDVDTIYVCTDSGREGEYIYRLIAQEVPVKGKKQLRVWIDSQTEEEIKRGIAEAKDLSAYDRLADAAYLRAQEDYLMGINFSRALTLKFGPLIASSLHERHSVISVGRVMTCVQGMVVRREREIRDFKKTPFYGVIAHVEKDGRQADAEWKVTPESMFCDAPCLYKENGFTKKEDAEKLVASLKEKSAIDKDSMMLFAESVSRKKEKKNPPLLFNLAELQNTCSRILKISPDETLKTAQELYEKKLVTYPRTDARVLSSAVAKEITKNIAGLRQFPPAEPFAEEILAEKKTANLLSSRYVDDRQITDHYALIPTGAGLSALDKCAPRTRRVYELIVWRFLAIFYPPAEYERISVTLARPCAGGFTEHFFSSERILLEEGYLRVSKGEEKEEEENVRPSSFFSQVRKGTLLPVHDFSVRESETSPPKRYTSGSLILAMENAGKLIEDEELREQIRGSGIGTSATRADILQKLVKDRYLSLNKKTQVISPTLLGEMIYDVVAFSMRQMANPEMTASWEKGLSYVEEGTVTPDEYRKKLDDFVGKRVAAVKNAAGFDALKKQFAALLAVYPAQSTTSTRSTKKPAGKSGSGTKKKTETHKKAG